MHFDYLVERLYPYLIKQDTIMRYEKCGILYYNTFMITVAKRGR